MSAKAFKKRGMIVTYEKDGMRILERRLLGRLYQLVYDPSSCDGCGICVKLCPKDAIEFSEPWEKIKISSDRCVFCGACTLACPLEMAIQLFINGERRAPIGE
jgi:ferredoxin